jgi:hypothetical protein
MTLASTLLTRMSLTDIKFWLNDTHMEMECIQNIEHITIVSKFTPVESLWNQGLANSLHAMLFFLNLLACNPSNLEVYKGKYYSPRLCLIFMQKTIWLISKNGGSS